MYVSLNVIMRPNTEARNAPATFYYSTVACDLRGNGGAITIVGNVRQVLFMSVPKRW